MSKHLKKKKEKKDKKDKNARKRKRDELDPTELPVEKKFKTESMAVKTEPIKTEPLANQIFIKEDDECPPVSNYRVCESTVKILAQNGIHTLFPIQANTFDHVFEGRDVVGRSRTGTGKTLSFALPIIERMLHDPEHVRRRNRGPKYIILTPTRELAIQVEKVVAMLCQDKLDSCCVYGGTSYDPQMNAIENGLDVVVGTPGRIIDLLDRRKLKLDSVKYFVCDEADEMLNMGFRDDIEKIMQSLPKDKPHQTLLYSATFPDWVKVIAQKFLAKNYITVDLVGQMQVKTSTGVKHLYLMTSKEGRAAALGLLVKVYSGGGKTMVFCDTKAQANEVGLSSSVSSECQVLHGDISQAQREVTMQSFRDGNFPILVATDVAARGLDVSGVDLVIHWCLPKEIESYIHRSGRTGRAGQSGTSISFCFPKLLNQLKSIEKAIGTSITRIGTPQPSDVYKASCETAMRSIMEVSREQIPRFLPFAKEAVMKFTGAEGDAVSSKDCLEVLALALASMTGNNKLNETSLLGGMQGHTTVLIALKKGSFADRSSIFGNIRKFLGADGPDVKSIRLTPDGRGVADVLTKFVKELDNPVVSVQIPTVLPELMDEDPRGTGNFGRGGGSSNGRGRGGGFGRDNGGGFGRDNGGNSFGRGGGRDRGPRGGGGRGGFRQ